MNKKNVTDWICISLVFFAAFMVSTVSAVNTTPIGSPDIQITPSSSTVEIGDTLVIEGVVSDTIRGITPGTVILILSLPTSSRLDSFTSVPLTDNGTFSYSILTDATGTWGISARYGDNTSAVTEVKVTPRETVKKTLNTLNSYGTPADKDVQVEMTGYLRDKLGQGLANKPVKYMVAIPPYGCSICSEDDDTLIWETYGTAYTDTTGRYSLTFTPYDRGQYRVKTYFGGDDIYQGSSSDTRSVRVT